MEIVTVTPELIQSSTPMARQFLEDMVSRVIRLRQRGVPQEMILLTLMAANIEGEADFDEITRLIGSNLTIALAALIIADSRLNHGD